MHRPTNYFVYIPLLVLCMYIGTYHTAYSKFFKSSPGDTGALNFFFNVVGNVSFEISFNNSEPFFKHGEKISGVLSPDQEERYSVSMERISDIIYVIKLKIEMLGIADEGYYICKVYFEELLTGFSQIIELEIEKPTGEFICYFPPFSNSYGGVWSVLECSVPFNESNYNNEQFYCFQSCEVVPPKTDPLMTIHNELVQKLWMKRSTNISCCLAPDKTEAVQNNCADYQWSPVQFHDERNLTLHTEFLSASTQPTSLDVAQSSTAVHLTLYIAASGTLLVFVLILCVLLCSSKRQKRFWKDNVPLEPRELNALNNVGKDEPIKKVQTRMNDSLHPQSEEIKLVEV